MSHCKAIVEQSAADTKNRTVTQTSRNMMENAIRIYQMNYRREELDLLLKELWATGTFVGHKGVLQELPEITGKENLVSVLT